MLPVSVRQDQGFALHRLLRPVHVPWLRQRGWHAHSTHTGYDAPIWVNLVDGDTAITTSSIGLTVNGAKVTPTVVKSGSNTSVTYTNASNWVPGTTNTVSLTFLDRTATWSFMVENHKNPTFFIEAEDFDSGGKGLPVASIMPYWGGAYVGLPATLNVDYYSRPARTTGRGIACPTTPRSRARLR